MSQVLLFPDPRPLVERLGPEFFRETPESPGVYLMRDSADEVLYVGKAKNLRKRLASYRVANPDRLRRRHLRLLRAVARIQVQECLHESEALEREAELLRSLRPRFNRAGTWPGTRRHLTWRVTLDGLSLAVTEAVEPGWQFCGPMGSAAEHLKAALVRLLWCALHPERGLSKLPAGWFHRQPQGTITIPHHQKELREFEVASARLGALFEGCIEEFAAWLRERTSNQTLPFELAVREADLEGVSEFAAKRRNPPPSPA